MKEFSTDFTAAEKNEILSLRSDLQARGDGTVWDTAAYDKLRKLLMYAAEMRIDDVRFSADTRETRLQLVPVPDQLQTNLSNSTVGEDTDPGMSPDGKTIIFNSTRNGKWEAWLMDLNGNNKRVIKTSLNGVFYPKFSPDGTQIVFSGPLEATYTATTIGNHDGNIFIMNADGTNIRNLALTPGAPNLSGFGYLAEWSPDGKWIVYSSGRNEHETDRPDLFKIRPDGTGETRVTNFDGTVTPTNALLPKWTSDSEYIYFAGISIGKEWDLWRIKADLSSPVERVTSQSGTQLNAVPSPYMDRVLYQGTSAGQYDIFNMNMNGSDEIQVTSGPVDDTRPIWFQDQSKIVFTSRRETGNRHLYSTFAYGMPSYPEFRHEYYMNESLPYFEAWAYDHVPSYADRGSIEVADLGRLQFRYREADPDIVDRSLLRHGFREPRLGEAVPEDVLKLTQPFPSTGALYPSTTLYPSDTLYPSE